MSTSEIGARSQGTAASKPSERSPSGETRVITGDQEVRRTAAALFERAAKMDPPSYVYTITDRRGPERAVDLLWVQSLANPGFVTRYIIDIQRENLESVRKIVAAGVQVRHIEGNRIGFSVSRDEYINDYRHRMGSGGEERTQSETIELVWSNNQDLVTQMRDTFEILWESAIPSEVRTKQLELGLEADETRIITDINETTELGWDLVGHTRSEVLIILASERTIERNSPMFQKLVDNVREKGMDMRILAPISEREDGTQNLPGVRWRHVRPMRTGIAIYDRERMLITQYVDPEAAELSRAVVSNIYTTNRQTIAGMVSLFEALWSESELREDDRKSRKQAELLQDIMSHDIRNYIQAAMAWGEILKDKEWDDPESQKIADGILDAVVGAMELVNKAGQLGRILSYRDKALGPVDLSGSLERAIEVTRKANPKKRIDNSIRVVAAQGRGENLRVFADGFLDDVFVNLYSNAAKYTQGDSVRVETVVEEIGSEGGQGPEAYQCKIAIIDRGKGISADVKRTLFGRYLATAEGRGLGLSIVYSLVVDRYAGKIYVSDRVADDPSQGTRFEVLLHAAPPPSPRAPAT